jgi:hypothetical protein
MRRMKQKQATQQPYSQPGSVYAEYIAGEIEYMSDRSMYKDPDDATVAQRAY